MIAVAASISPNPKSALLRRPDPAIRPALSRHVGTLAHSASLPVLVRLKRHSSQLIPVPQFRIWPL